MRIGVVVGFALLLALLGVAATAQQKIVVTVDEYGNGTMSPGPPIFSSVGQDPGPGGLPNALIYDFGSLPALWTVGDLVLQEPTPTGAYAESDLIRFNANGTLAFYSDIETSEPKQGLADVGIPTPRYTNGLALLEAGSEGKNGVIYLPNDPNMPGYCPGLQVEYHVISDVPEPSSLLALLGGVGGLGGLILRKRS